MISIALAYLHVHSRETMRCDDCAEDLHRLCDCKINWYFSN